VREEFTRAVSTGIVLAKKEERLRPGFMASSEQTVQECDARDDQSELPWLVSNKHKA